MPTPAGLARTPGIPSLAGLACLTLALTLAIGTACWLLFGYPAGLAFGAVGLLGGTGTIGILADTMRDDNTPVCGRRDCPCTCHTEERRRG